MNDFTASHLNCWLEQHVAECERESTLNSILSLLVDYSDLPDTHSWPEIRTLAERAQG